MASRATLERFQGFGAYVAFTEEPESIRLLKALELTGTAGPQMTLFHSTPCHFIGILMRETDRLPLGTPSTCSSAHPPGVGTGLPRCPGFPSHLSDVHVRGTGVSQVPRSEWVGVCVRGPVTGERPVQGWVPPCILSCQDKLQPPTPWTGFSRLEKSRSCFY